MPKTTRYERAARALIKAWATYQTDESLLNPTDSRTFMRALETLEHLVRKDEQLRARSAHHPKGKPGLFT